MIRQVRCWHLERIDGVPCAVIRLPECARYWTREEWTLIELLANISIQP